MQLGEDQNQRHTVTFVILAALKHPGIPGGSFFSRVCFRFTVKRQIFERRFGIELNSDPCVRVCVMEVPT